ncbi:Guanylyl cyclase [Dimargaris cristalligena]|uniref:Guanylyl cyclase n=1 Tax=Dimargaris cristalligena TaxID=215637 RepID=A0A4P9ZZR6_9FUNG|nr:Guanylyl cyclase [Dimargaris cristalligena]|eukprot:RKP39233.1 Guanylyl cyclase [Dimargaris cristalligena]
MPRKRPRTFYHPVPHIMQWYSWDCGLACVCMILHYYGLTQFNMEDLLRYCKCESIWTIDVAFILRKFLGVDFTYYTRYLGINPEYAGNTFYQDTIDEDQQRVEQLFQVAHRNNVRIIRIALPLLDIKRFVAERKFAIIMLVNARLLRCEYCTQESKRTHCLSYTCLKTLFDTKEYVGHFILVVGYNFILDTFYYRDPALEDELCQIKASVLEKARASDGTDFDSIVVRL